MPRGLIRRLLASLPSGNPLTLVDVGSMGGLEPADRVRTLDEVVPAADFIKLDTQGSELSIFKLSASAPCYGDALPGRDQLIRWMRGLAPLLGRSDQGFSDADAVLGNGG